MLGSLLIAALMSGPATDDCHPHPHTPGDGCECVYDAVFYTPRPPGPPIHVHAPAVRVRGAPVHVPGPVVYVSGPPIYVDAPPVHVGPADIRIARPDIRVRPSEVIIAPPVVSFEGCPAGSSCPPGRP